MKSVQAAILLLVLLAGCSQEISPSSSQNPSVASTGTKPVIDLDSVPLSAVSPAALCSEEKKTELKAELFAQATTGADSVHIDCSLMLTGVDVQERGQITKRLIFDTSGVTVDCSGVIINGGPGTFNYQNHPHEPMVEINSKPIAPDAVTNLPRWDPTHDVTLRHCQIFGAVHVYGSIGEPKENTYRSDWVTRVRNNAPYNILFDDVIISGIRGDILYIFGGVHGFQLINSEMTSSSPVNGVNIYLDAESYDNTFRDNYIHAQTDQREVMSIDGSSGNMIVNNKFSALNHGGIYLYRNCGEKGVIRHSTPSFNKIVNNVFYYEKYTGGNPAIFVGQRNGTCCGGIIPIPLFGEIVAKHCWEDNGYPFGSSVSNYDHAQFNVVMQNQIYWPQLVGKMIKVGRPDINAPNYIGYNETVIAETSRRAGCYIGKSYPDSKFAGHPDFIWDGQFFDLTIRNGEPVCSSTRSTCNDGVLSESLDSTCRVSQVDFECKVNDNNNGCRKTVSVPAGKEIIGVKAACNLEFGTVSATDLNEVPANSLKVLRASDNISEGKCTLGGTNIRTGQVLVSGIFGLNRVSVGCREHDSNGGDCHIKGTLYYR